VTLGLVPLAPHKALPFATLMACGSTLVQVGFAGDAARLRLGSETRELAPVETASGARYSDGGLPETAFWSRGDRATVTWSGLELPECAPFPDPARQTVTARGNEPGWVMTAGPDGLSLSTEAGEALAGALPPAQVTAETVTWAIPGGPALTLAPGLCQDSMTGMPHPLSATLTRDGQALPGCAGDPGALLAGDWRVTELADAPLPEGAEASLTFDAGQASGRAVCNRFTAGYTITGEGLRLGPAAATRMACPPDRMAAEGAFLAALAKVDRFDITPEGGLALIGGDRVLLRAVR
jgi:heat shock protein HslJ